jgi:hypothetical protein
MCSERRRNRDCREVYVAALSARKPTLFISRMLLMNAKSVSGLLWLTYAAAAQDLLRVLAAVLAIQVVKRISRAQDVAAHAARVERAET